MTSLRGEVTDLLSRLIRLDTTNPPGGGAARPHITGPGLAGPGFYTTRCTRS